MGEYISEGKDGFLIDPDPNLLYTNQKLAKQGASSAVADVPKEKLKFSKSGWGSQLEKMPLFTRAEMNEYIENSGKRLGSSHHSDPTSWKKGKTFLEDEYLRDNALATRSTLIFAVSAITPSEKMTNHITLS